MVRMLSAFFSFFLALSLSSSDTYVCLWQVRMRVRTVFLAALELASGESKVNDRFTSFPISLGHLLTHSLETLLLDLHRLMRILENLETKSL